MCYRFFVKASTVEAAALRLGAALREAPPSRYNIAPTSPVLAFRKPEGAGSPQSALLHWGLVPHWARDSAAFGASLANARSESLADKPSFRGPFRHRRCIIPASGFYEWETLPSGRKQPWVIHNRDDSPLLIAGLWDSWESPSGALESCTLITTTPNDVVAPLHDRMPVILEPEAALVWLERTPEAGIPGLGALLRPCAPAPQERFRVDPRVNSVRNDDAACIAPWEPPPEGGGQATLNLGFD